MSIRREAKLYYGYSIDLSKLDENNSEKIWEINEKLDIKAAKVNSLDKNSKAVVGKEIESAPAGKLEKISASSLLQKLTSIPSSKELDQIMDKFNLENDDPKLIICSDIS